MKYFPIISVIFLSLLVLGTLWFLLPTLVVSPVQHEESVSLEEIEESKTAEDPVIVNDNYDTEEALLKKEETPQVTDTAPIQPPQQTSPNSEESVTSIAKKSNIDTTTLPLGDGKRSTEPKRGYVYSCQTQFSASAGGAQADGPWINGTTWDLTQKIFVQGNVVWKNAWFKEIVTNLSRLLTGNGLPVASVTGNFPVSSTDPAYQYDRNPNSITSQDVEVTLPTNPTIAQKASCVPMGVIGRAVNGVAIFNALDGRGDDAVAHEVQDSCNGHPERTGEYHYHGPSDCIPGADEPNTLIGYANDGFGIFSRFDFHGNEYTNADLDECHGTTSLIEWNGEMVEMYHYVLTQEYPYTIGCFRGTPVAVSNSMNGDAEESHIQPEGATNGPNNTGQNQPPAEAIAACNNKSTNSSCSINTPQGTRTGTCKQPPNSSSLACIPN